MRPDYRLSVIRSTLSAMPDLPEGLRHPIDEMTKKYVRVHGFRNSEKAPAVVKAGPMADAFEKRPEIVAAVLAAWAEVNGDLRQKVYDLLKGRGWFLLPLPAFRQKLPGFFSHWPKVEDFETLNKAFGEAYPDSQYSSDDISLMVVWISSRLPYILDEGTVEEVTKLVDFDLEQLLPGKGSEPESAASAEQ